MGRYWNNPSKKIKANFGRAERSISQRWPMNWTISSPTTSHIHMLKFQIHVCGKEPLVRQPMHWTEIYLLRWAVYVMVDPEEHTTKWHCSWLSSFKCTVWCSVHLRMTLTECHAWWSWDPDEVMRMGLSRWDLYLYRKRLQGASCLPLLSRLGATQQKGDQLHAMKRTSLIRNKPCWHLDLGLSASKTMGR